MKDVTYKEIRKVKTLLAAIKCSMKHHLYNYTVSNIEKTDIYSDKCALCYYIKKKRGRENCEKCPLHDKDFYCCKEWEELYNAKTDLNSDDFHTAAAKIYTRLALIREKIRKSK